MGRRDHLLRIALSAKQSQLTDPPSSSDHNDDDGDGDIQPSANGEQTTKLGPSTAKLSNQAKLDAAQEAILSAIGFMTDSGLKRTDEKRDREGVSISTFVGLITYHLPLPMYSQRNQALVTTPLPGRLNSFHALSSVLHFCLVSWVIPVLIQAFRIYDQSYLSLFRQSWRKAGWSLLWIGMPSMVVYQLGYNISMHYLQPRIVHKFRKSYPPASGKSLEALCIRLGVSLTYNPSQPNPTIPQSQGVNSV
jgi:hypothetical protein